MNKFSSGIAGLVAIIASGVPAVSQEAGSPPVQAVEKAGKIHAPEAGRKDTSAVRQKQSRNSRSAKRSRQAADGAPFHDQIARHAQDNGVPVDLARAVVRIESGYNARVVHAGNYGLMQIRLQTARGMGFGGTGAGLLDADTNLHFGMKYLALAYRQAGGDTCRTLMRYQSGIAAKRMSSANRAYCAKAMRMIASR